MDVTRIDNTTGEPPAELHDHFQGEARIQPIPLPFPGGNPAVFAVHFSAGGRTMPHVHKAGQLLVITGGRGMIGRVDGPVVVEAGDVVSIQSDEWHWHGGTPTSAMTHVTVQMSGPDSIDWHVDERDWATTYQEPDG